MIYLLKRENFGYHHHIFICDVFANSMKPTRVFHLVGLLCNFLSKSKKKGVSFFRQTSKIKNKTLWFMESQKKNNGVE